MSMYYDIEDWPGRNNKLMKNFNSDSIPRKLDEAKN